MSRDAFKPFVAGSLAGVTTKTATAPLERVKTLQQVEGMLNNGKPPPVLQVFRNIWVRDGLRGFWFGNGTNCLRVVPVYALKFGFNERIKDECKARLHKDTLGFGELVLCGSVAGFLQITATYPLETVRTRLTVGEACGAKYNGAVHCFRSIVAHEGAAGLYKGLAVTYASGIPYVGLQMSFFTFFDRHLGAASNNAHSVLRTVACGALAGMLAQTTSYPGDTVRKRMQTDGVRGARHVYKGTWDCAKLIVRQEGFAALYSGLGVNLLRGIPGASIQFTTFGLFKQLLNM